LSPNTCLPAAGSPDATTVAGKQVFGDNCAACLGVLADVAAYVTRDVATKPK
jgi:hypothetical protein